MVNLVEYSLVLGKFGARPRQITIRKYSARLQPITPNYLLVNIFFLLLKKDNNFLSHVKHLTVGAVLYFVTSLTIIAINFNINMLRLFQHAVFFTCT